MYRNDDTKLHLVVTSGVEVGDVPRKKGKQDFICISTALFHPVQKTQASVLQENVFIEVKFISHKTYHLNHFKV